MSGKMTTFYASEQEYINSVSHLAPEGLICLAYFVLHRGCNFWVDLGRQLYLNSVGECETSLCKRNLSHAFPESTGGCHTTYSFMRVSLGLIGDPDM